MLNESVIQLVSAHQKHIRDLATKFLVPTEGTNESKDAKKMGDALAAVEVVISLVNIFNTVFNTSRTNLLDTIVDLTFTLNSNPFWARNSAYLMPLFTAALNSAMDYRDTENNKEPLWEKLRYHDRNMWLELLPAIMFLVHGYIGMRLVSNEMKKTFEAMVQ